MRSHPIVLLVSAVVLSAHLARAQQIVSPPPWRSRLMPWQTHAGQARPWRTDARLASFVEQGFPDDVLVLFGSSDSVRGRKPETLWVTVTAYDSATAFFLAILREKPLAPMDVAVGDNVPSGSIPS